jgi:hypothetical protein
VTQGPGVLPAPAILMAVVTLRCIENRSEPTGDRRLRGKIPHAIRASAILQTPLQARSVSDAWERARGSTVFKSVRQIASA